MLAPACSGNWTKCDTQPACPDAWKLSVLTVVLITWGFAMALPMIGWLLVVLITRDATDRMANIRDTITVALMSPFLAFATIFMWLWSKARPHLLTGVNKASPEMNWRALWETTGQLRDVMVTSAAAGLFLMSLLTLIAALPQIPGVDAQCTDVANFSKCTIGANTLVSVNNVNWYLNMTTIFVIEVGQENSGSQKTWFRQPNLKATLNCAGPRNNGLVPLIGFPLDAHASVEVGGSTCWGGTLSLGIPIGAVLSFGVTAVYCKEQKDTVKLKATDAQLYADFSQGTPVNEFQAETAILPTLCGENVGCFEFPLAANGIDYGLLFIKEDGSTASTDATGAGVAVQPPAAPTGPSMTVMCNADGCWRKPLSEGDCPAVYQYLGLSAVQLQSGQATFDQSKIPETLVGTSFFTNSVSHWAQLALACVNAINAETTYEDLPGWLDAGYDPGEQERIISICQTSGYAELTECIGQGISTGLTGQQSPVPSQPGTVVFTCPSSSPLPATWYNVKNPSKNQSSSCVFRKLGLADCHDCGNFSTCYPPGQQPPNLQQLEQQMTIGTNSVGNYVPGAAYCMLEPVAAGRVTIAVNPLNPPCLSTGQMYSGIMTGPMTWEVNVNGWAVQASGTGFLFWLFHARTDVPGTENVNWNVTIDPIPGAGEGSYKCAADPWDCNHDPICMLAQVTNNEDCKCAFIANPSTKPSTGCKWLHALLALAFWGGIAGLVIILMLSLYRAFKDRQQPKQL